MNKAIAISPANIAFIKYWGKKNPEENIPFNDSLSMNLSQCYTVTSVYFNEKLTDDVVSINGQKLLDNKKQRVVQILDLVKKKAGINLRAEVISKNNFPTAAGIASSASAFSALALAASSAAGLNLTTKELSILARRGSGSACRSVVDGFAWWKKGHNTDTSYAVQLAPKNFWKLRDIVTIVAEESKKVGSTEGHEMAISSPFFKERLKILPRRIKALKEAFGNKDFKNFGKLLEEEAVELHIVAMTSYLPIFYWNEGTVQVMRNLREWREEGLLGFYTMDAGANVHVICLERDCQELNNRLRSLSLVRSTIVNSPAKGTRLISNKEEAL